MWLIDRTGFATNGRTEAWSRGLGLRDGEKEQEMSVMAMAFPILPGKTAAWRAWMDELNGPRHEQFVESRSRAGVEERTFLQQTPTGDLVIVTLSGDDPGRAFQEMMAATDTRSRPGS